MCGWGRALIYQRTGDLPMKLWITGTWRKGVDKRLKSLKRYKSQQMAVWRMRPIHWGKYLVKARADKINVVMRLGRSRMCSVCLRGFFGGYTTFGVGGWGGGGILFFFFFFFFFGGGGELTWCFMCVWSTVTEWTRYWILNKPDTRYWITGLLIGPL